MKILFITPTYELGRDGVADYTHRLIDEIQRQDPKIKCNIIAWNDGFISTSKKEAEQLRLPSILSETDKLTEASSFIKSFSPDWVSLQWVPYGYNPKGIFSKQIHSFSQLLTDESLQIMVHETWIGAKLESSLKEKMIGTYQRFLFRKLIKRLNPDVIHTQAKAYQHLLNNEGIKARLLPLFSNIEAQKATIQPRKDDELRVGFFGAIHQGTDLDTCIPNLLKLSSRQNKSLHIFHMGKLDNSGAERFKNWEESWGSQLKFHLLGEQSEIKVSEYLFSLDIGLSTNPLVLIDKSGSIAAMLEHQLPIINLRDDIHFRGFSPEIDNSKIFQVSDIEDLLHNYLEDRCNSEANINKPSIQVIAKSFLDSII